MKHDAQSNNDELKKAAAYKALEFVPEGEIFGVGTGTTASFFIEALSTIHERVKGVVSSSNASTLLLHKYDIPVFELSEVGHLSVYIDGADEINHSLQMIKGGGGALLREKILAHASREVICIADESKYVSRLGAFPLPVEVVPMARSYVARQLIKLGGMPEFRNQFVTDNGNHILDIHNFRIDQPVTMEDKINAIAGVIDNGLFAHRRADILILARESGVEVLR